ncbi:MAG: hypothetical protein R2821_07080 [Flavobacteriaceae bacterium]
MKKFFTLPTFIIVSNLSFGQNLEDLDSYTVDEFYKKSRIRLWNPLDEDGDEIEYIYVKTECRYGRL